MMNGIQSALSALKLFTNKLDNAAQKIARTVPQTSTATGSEKADIFQTPHDESNAKETGAIQPSGGFDRIDVSRDSLTEGIVETLVSRRLYEANLNTIKTTDELLGSIVNIKK